MPLLSKDDYTVLQIIRCFKDISILEKNKRNYSETVPYYRQIFLKEN